MCIAYHSQCFQIQWIEDGDIHKRWIHQSRNKPLKPHHLAQHSIIFGPVWLWYLILDHFYYGPNQIYAFSRYLQLQPGHLHFSAHTKSFISIPQFLLQAFCIASPFHYFFSSLHFFFSPCYCSRLPVDFFFSWALESTWKTKPKWFARNRILWCGPCNRSTRNSV